jgi:hypothetical protein
MNYKKYLLNVASIVFTIISGFGFNSHKIFVGSSLFTNTLDFCRRANCYTLSTGVNLNPCAFGITYFTSSYCNNRGAGHTWISQFSSFRLATTTP